jgi:hypothetical protein
MNPAVETMVLTLPRAVVPELPALSRGLSERMHGLLERNTEGMLSATEREELETLVEMAQFAQIHPPGASRRGLRAGRRTMPSSLTSPRGSVRSRP